MELSVNSSRRSVKSTMTRAYMRRGMLFALLETYCSLFPDKTYLLYKEFHNWKTRWPPEFQQFKKICLWFFFWWDLSLAFNVLLSLSLLKDRNLLSFCLDVAQGHMKGAPNETRTRSWRFASRAFSLLKDACFTALSLLVGNRYERKTVLPFFLSLPLCLPPFSLSHTHIHICHMYFVLIIILKAARNMTKYCFSIKVTLHPLFFIMTILQPICNMGNYC